METYSNKSQSEPFQCSLFLKKYLSLECTLSIVCSNSNSSGISADALTSDIRYIPCADRIPPLDVDVETTSTLPTNALNNTVYLPSPSMMTSTQEQTSATPVPATYPKLVTDSPRVHGVWIIAISIALPIATSAAVLLIVVCWMRRRKKRGSIDIFCKSSAETRVTGKPLEDIESMKVDSKPNSFVDQSSEGRNSVDTGDQTDEQQSIEDVIMEDDNGCSPNNQESNSFSDTAPQDTTTTPVEVTITEPMEAILEENNQDNNSSVTQDPTITYVEVYNTGTLVETTINIEIDSKDSNFVSAIPQDISISSLEMCTTCELVEAPLEQERHVQALTRPAPSAPLSASPEEIQSDGGPSPSEGVEQSPDGIHQENSESINQSHALVLHHDNKEDAAIALRITEDLKRNGIPCVSHHLEYSKILEMGEKGWLTSSLQDCYCVLPICTKAFQDASLGIWDSHFFVSQRLIAEAVPRLSYAADGVRQSSPYIYPIVRKAHDRKFIPKRMKDFQWFQLPSENQWSELISTIRQRDSSLCEPVECVYPHYTTGGDSAYGSTQGIEQCTCTAV